MDLGDLNDSMYEGLFKICNLCEKKNIEIFCLCVSHGLTARKDAFALYSLVSTELFFSIFDVFSISHIGKCKFGIYLLICMHFALQVAGNEAFQAGRHTEAVEHYTTALSCNTESRPFTAVCFCNRAAAYKALGQITDAIADCSLAIALDGSYLKVCSKLIISTWFLVMTLLLIFIYCIYTFVGYL